MMAKKDILTFVIFITHDIKLRSVAMRQRFDSETKSVARVMCPHIAHGIANEIDLCSNGF
jgi:hypothetical protein